MALSIVSLLLALLLVVGLNRGTLARLGLGETARLMLVWAVVLAGGVLLVRVFGLA